ncbi:MAG: HAD family hydrolase [Erysipelotrichaceae bacterium]
MIKLACFDVDDTLYDSNTGSVYSSSVEAIKQMKKNGIKIAIVTGRPHYALEDKIKDICPDYVIGSNGQVVIKENSIISCTNLEPKDVEYVNSICSEKKCPLIFKFIDSCGCNPYVDQFTWNKRIKNSDEMFNFVSDNNQLHKERNVQNLIIKCDEKTKHLIETKVPYVEFVHAVNGEYDMNLKGYNKSTGIEVILKDLSIEWDDVFAIGDNENDIDMVKKAGCGCAVGGAVETLKLVAKHVSLNIEEDGVCILLKSILEGEGYENCNSM